MVIHIAAKDIRVGDEVYNKHAKHPAFQWTRVREIKPTQVAVTLEGGSVKEVEGFEFNCGAYTFTLTAREGFSVRRLPDVSSSVCNY